MKTHRPNPVRHPKSEWRSSRKSKTRRFALTIDVPLYYPVVEYVLDSIENDTLHVFHPDDERALQADFNRKGEQLVNKRATLPISIREWLCVGCQSIEMGESEDPHCLAYFTCNAHEAIFPMDSLCAFGPAAFTGKIVLTNRCLPKNNSDTEAKAFAFVVAHELVHVFDTMRFVVPAIMDWKQFWGKVLNEGICCDLARGMLENKTLFLDDYGSRNELAMVKEYWPSKAKEWFDASRKGKGSI